MATRTTIMVAMVFTTAKLDHDFSLNKTSLKDRHVA